jgi:AAA+ ATPase superfamily predicted ATPase
MRHTFLNRHRELRALEEAIRSPRAEMVILYGRRGVGKSALMQQDIEQNVIGTILRSHTFLSQEPE